MRGSLFCLCFLPIRASLTLSEWRGVVGLAGV